MVSLLRLYLPLPLPSTYQHQSILIPFPTAADSNLSSVVFLSIEIHTNRHINANSTFLFMLKHAAKTILWPLAVNNVKASLVSKRLQHLAAKSRAMLVVTPQFCKDHPALFCTHTLHIAEGYTNVPFSFTRQIQFPQIPRLHHRFKSWEGFCCLGSRHARKTSQSWLEVINSSEYSLAAAVWGMAGCVLKHMKTKYVRVCERL